MIGLGLGLSPAFAGRFSPRIDSPAAWYESSQGVTSSLTLVSQWSDISGNNRHLLQASAGQKPIVLPNLINGFPAIRFDGVDDYLKATAFTLNQPETMFLVFKNITYGTSGVHDIVADGNTAGSMTVGSILAASTGISAGSAIAVAQGINNGVYGVSCFRWNGASSFIRNNGVEIKTGNVGANNAGGLTLGALGNNTRATNIEVAELIIFSTAISTSQIQDIEGELKLKYGTP